MWGQWNECTKSCATGEQTRTRECVEPQHEGETCQGDASETRICNTHECPGKSLPSIKGKMFHTPFRFHGIDSYYFSSELENLVSITDIELIQIQSPYQYLIACMNSDITSS